MDTIPSADDAHMPASPVVHQNVASDELAVYQDLVETNELYADLTSQSSTCSSEAANQEVLDAKEIETRRILEVLQVCELGGLLQRNITALLRTDVVRSSDMDLCVISAMLVSLEPRRESQRFCVLVAHVQKASCKAFVSGTLMSLSSSSLYAESRKASMLS
ncbi:hypothetical protein FGB62_85g10 [Gracilaria domingensis]|nr:hypothetical protein FGB62_85g10 [Gracilaria domingensis]